MDERGNGVQGVEKEVRVDLHAQCVKLGLGEPGLQLQGPAGALLRMRINQTLTSASAKAGDSFDGIVVNDVVAGGAVAQTNRTIVNWDVEATDWNALTTRAHDDWIRLSSK